MDTILKRAFINAVGTATYIVLVASFVFSLRYFSPQAEDALIIPIAMLLLFVCSAAITAFLVFGKPTMLYLDGKKKEAVSLLSYTIGMLVFITLVVFISLIVYFI